MWYKAQKVQKYALNSQLQALQILKNDDKVENWSLSSFLLAVIYVEHFLSQKVRTILLFNKIPFVLSKKATNKVSRENSDWNIGLKYENKNAPKKLISPHFIVLGK